MATTTEQDRTNGHREPARQTETDTETDAEHRQPAPDDSLVDQHWCESLVDRVRGVKLREPSPTEEYITRYVRVRPRTVRMIGVREPIEVEFRVLRRGAGKVTKRARLEPWTGSATAMCNEIVRRGVPR